MSHVKAFSSPSLSCISLLCHYIPSIPGDPHALPGDPHQYLSLLFHYTWKLTSSPGDNRFNTWGPSLLPGAHINTTFPCCFITWGPTWRARDDTHPVLLDQPLHDVLIVLCMLWKPCPQINRTCKRAMSVGLSNDLEAPVHLSWTLWFKWRRTLRFGQNCIRYIYTVYDRIFGDFPAKSTVYAPLNMVLANPTYAVLLHHVVIPLQGEIARGMIHWGIETHWGMIHRGMIHRGMLYWNMAHWGMIHWGMIHWGMIHWNMAHWGMID